MGTTEIDVSILRILSRRSFDRVKSQLIGSRSVSRAVGIVIWKANENKSL